MKAREIIELILNENEVEAQGVFEWYEEDSLEESLCLAFGFHSHLSEGTIDKDALYLYYYGNLLGGDPADAVIDDTEHMIYLYKIE